MMLLLAAFVVGVFLVVWDVVLMLSDSAFSSWVCETKPSSSLSLGRCTC